MKRLFYVLCCVVGALLAASPLHAQAGAEPGVPEPELVTSSWALTFEHSTPDTVAIRQRDGTIQWYWYMTYKVFNDPRIHSNRGEPILFIPEIIVADDRGGIRHANRRVHPRVFRAVKRLTGNEFLESPAEVPGDILPGEDFITEGVAIWPVFEGDVDEFTLFFGGLYGESVHVSHPVTGEPMRQVINDPETGEPKVDADGDPVTRPVMLRRTRALRFATPGTVHNPQDQSISLIESKDVMR